MTTPAELHAIAARIMTMFPDSAARLSLLAARVAATERALDQIAADAPEEARIAGMEAARDACVNRLEAERKMRASYEAGTEERVASTAAMCEIHLCIEGIDGLIRREKHHG